MIMISLLECIAYLNTFINIYRIKTYLYIRMVCKQIQRHINRRLTMIN